MGKADGSPGLSRLARVMSGRMRQFAEQTAEDITPDFGVIGKGLSLTTNRFPVAIPKGEYHVGRLVSGLKITITGGTHGGHESGNGSHSHTVELPKLKEGDHVLVIWVQDEPVVTDVLRKL